MRQVPRLKAYYTNPAKVHAGRIDRVMYDDDNEDYPVMAWIDKDYFPLAEEVVEYRDPEVGDWLVIPKHGEEWQFEKAVIISAREFHLMYDEKNGRGREAAVSYGNATH